MAKRSKTSPKPKTIRVKSAGNELVVAFTEKDWRPSVAHPLQREVAHAVFTVGETRIQVLGIRRKAA